LRVVSTLPNLQAKYFRDIRVRHSAQSLTRPECTRSTDGGSVASTACWRKVCRPASTRSAARTAVGTGPVQFRRELGPLRKIRCGSARFFWSRVSFEADLSTALLSVAPHSTWVSRSIFFTLCGGLSALLRLKSDQRTAASARQRPLNPAERAQRCSSLAACRTSPLPIQTQANLSQDLDSRGDFAHLLRNGEDSRQQSQSVAVRIGKKSLRGLIHKEPRDGQRVQPLLKLEVEYSTQSKLGQLRHAGMRGISEQTQRERPICCRSDRVPRSGSRRFGGAVILPLTSDRFN
jgi:hypothetical protein